MNDPILLHAGFDNFDLAYNTQIGADLQKVLAVAKVAAMEERRAQPVTFGGHTFMVEGHGGRGGYAYSVDTGELGANWWFKEPRTARDPWGVRASSRALPLAVHGIEHVKQAMDQFLTDLGMTFEEVDRRISRLDYALDFLLPGFSIEPENFVSHARRTKSISGEFSQKQRGTVTNGILIGKMPNAEICIYDKRREVIDKRRPYWWEIWEKRASEAGVALSKDSEIWRFEFRAGRKAIDALLRRRTWEAFTRNPAHIFRKLAFQTRLAEPSSDTNRARWPNARIWDVCQRELERISLDHDSDVDVSRIIAELKAANLRTLEAQTVGLVLAQAAAYGLNEGDLPTVLKQVGLDVEAALAGKVEGAGAFLVRRGGEFEARYGC
ncbi:hypothetical protein [Maricaulis sp.]|uniref:hypothetical protein n=1 Tax=Maricaulis sp. TaxID=1486257 RepID=UPI001B1A0C3E|nr:hypothetical protein [Maricaulis sp.]MBO6796952.1 hypothetical protein [Maricaulis sp.]